MQHRRCITQLLLTTLAAVVLATGSSAAQDTAASAHAASLLPPYRYRVLGVFDAASGQPVADADVADILTGASATTSRTGTVALSFLPDGGGLVRIRKFGYAMQTLAVSVSPADTTPVTVVLTPAVRLPGVTTHGRSSYISPNLRGFEDRRLHGATGYFIPDSVLRKEEERPLANVLESHVPGIN
ncbi:MAG TPA: carboxypeptidase-like regulatory domain-containing protein, partial [Gemmatimonadaceae bacterium]|nr:carboxypeptidase-like regulatory domain-containing protein [Gemmatimonadaceae bacterium]